MGQYSDSKGNVHWDDEFNGPSSTKWKTTSRVAQPLLNSVAAAGTLTITTGNPVLGATVGVGMLGYQLIDTMHKRSIRPGISIIEEYSSDNLIDSILDNKNVFGDFSLHKDKRRLFLDALALSQDVYVVNNHSPNFYHTYSFRYSEPKEKGWLLINENFRNDEIEDIDIRHLCGEIQRISHNFNNVISGLGSMACICRFTNDMYIVAYVFEGTYPKETQDLGADIEQGLMGKTPQYEQAIYNAQLIASKFNKNSNIRNKCKLYYFGHSLGGGLANIAALSTGYPSITFNAASLHPDYVSMYEDNFKQRILVGAYLEGEVLSSKASKAIGLPKVGDRYKIELKNISKNKYKTKSLSGVMFNIPAVRKHMLEPLIEHYYNTTPTTWNKTNKL